MSYKVSAFCMIAFLLFFTLSSYAAAARHEPADNRAAPIKTDQYLGGELGLAAAEKVEVESCEGMEEEECLMRRTLAAHIDYIYTQKSNP